jgi:hypothetical protein
MIKISNILQNVYPFRDVATLMQTARDNGLRYPKVTTRTVQFSLTGDKSKYGPGHVHVTSANCYGESEWYGRIDPDGGWHPARDIPEPIASHLSEIQVSGATTYLAELGRWSERCAFCHRELSTPESLSAGYGPDCAEHYSLPWGDRSGFLSVTSLN